MKTKKEPSEVEVNMKCFLFHDAQNKENWEFSLLSYKLRILRGNHNFYACNCETLVVRVTCSVAE